MTVEIVLGSLLAAGVALFGVTKLLQKRLERYDAAEGDDGAKHLGETVPGTSETTEETTVPGTSETVPGTSETLRRR